MIRRVVLIAEREFRTYTTTVSFWVALALGPVLLAGALLVAGRQPPQAPVASLELRTQPDGALSARFSRNFPLSPAARNAVIAEIAKSGRPVHIAAEPKHKAIDVEAIGRFGLVMMLWMTLTGSLGMLLQAVVRERSTRSLETLMAAAGPVEIVLGKLAGVGAVSALVVSAWLASTALSAAAAQHASPLAALFSGFDGPWLVLKAALIYPLAFAFYGLVTIAVGARARDNADAQNMARPMFIVLLGAFFVALAATSGVHTPSALALAPPLAPFFLLLQPHPIGVEIAAIALLMLATLAAGHIAVRSLSIRAQ